MLMHDFSLYSTLNKLFSSFFNEWIKLKKIVTYLFASKLKKIFPYLFSFHVQPYFQKSHELIKMHNNNKIREKACNFCVISQLPAGTAATAS